MSDNGIRIDEVESVAPAPRARVDLQDVSKPKNDGREDFERKKDYLAGFLKAEPPKLAGGEPGGDLYEAVVDALKEIYDPEIPVNIYELGLIYGIKVDEGHVTVSMTLTTPNCPVAESMPMEVEMRVGAVPGVGVAEVNLVWDPPWDSAKMSDEAKLELGML